MMEMEVAASSRDEGTGKRIKRKPSNDLSDQRLAKRFDLLNIDNKHRKQYIPVSGKATNPARPPPAADSDYMELEDSKHKVYVYDLDKELEDCQSDEDHPIFIPDIEKHLINLPKVVLMADDMREMAKNMQLVLYHVPHSLTVPEEKDSVRKAIMESRQRMREKQALSVPDAPTSHLAPVSMNAVREGHSNLRTPSANRPREPNALLVPTVPPAYLEPATMNGISPHDDFDAMDMD